MQHCVLVPRGFANSDQNLDMNCLPQSGVISVGTPKRDTQLLSKARAQDTAVASFIGIASGHDRSTIVNTCRRYNGPGLFRRYVAYNVFTVTNLNLMYGKTAVR